MSSLFWQPVFSVHPSWISASVHRRAPSPVQVTSAVASDSLWEQPIDWNIDSAQTKQPLDCW